MSKSVKISGLEVRDGGNLQNLVTFATGKELRAIAQKRAVYHVERAQKRAEMLDRLGTELDEMLDDARSVGERMAIKGGSTYQNTVHQMEDLRTSLRQHYHKAGLFRFFSEHFADDTYELSVRDLDILEIPDALGTGE